MDIDMEWIALGMGIIGAIVALVAAFIVHSTEWIVVGAVIAGLGIMFRPRR